MPPDGYRRDDDEPDRDGDESDGDERPRARAFWSGTISFGLVSIPVDLYPGTRPGSVSFRMLDEDGTPLGRRYYCPGDGREVDSEEIVRGYEMDNGEFVVVTDEELESLAPEKTRDIDLRRFVPQEQIDPLFLDRAYFLTPGGDSTKAYRLLAKTMEDTGRAGIATFVMRGKEYLVAILAENGILRAETLRFADEVRAADEMGLPAAAKATGAAVTKLRKQIQRLERKALDIAELRDDYAERVEALVARKLKAGEDVVTAPEGAEGERETEVIDLMQVLKQRMRGEGGPDVRRPPRRARASAGDRTRRAAGLDTLSKQQLYERAKQLDIPGRSSMSKTELIRAISKTA
ncbi:MAG: Ku protein [Longimicrobiales bacterium]